MNAASQYVCAFRGSRDYYEAPLALAEGGLLDRFITDAYATPWVRTLAAHVSSRTLKVLASRHVAGIPDERVDCLWATALREQCRHALGWPPNRTRMEFDPRYSEAAAARARQSRANLFLYSPYAWEAFTASYRHEPRRVLFQYHPHPETERQWLADDAAHDAGAARVSDELDARPQIERLVRRERDCWQHADLILCSSAFTRRSLIDAGCPETRCRVIPYGVDLPVEVPAGAGETFEALFVGSGSRRKGVRHLLQAWAAARLPAGSRLTLVCRVLDDGLDELIRRTPGVQLVAGATRRELLALYARSTLFVMPSLVEGFGLVYLEALAHGCPVLGTPNTCLPDLGGEQDGIFVTPPAQSAELAAALERCAATLTGSAKIRAAARATAARYPWSAFRNNVRAALKARS